MPLQARDIIRQLNNRQMVTLQSLKDALQALPVGKPATLQIQRDGRLMFLSFIRE